MTNTQEIHTHKAKLGEEEVNISIVHGHEGLQVKLNPLSKDQFDFWDTTSFPYFACVLLELLSQGYKDIEPPLPVENQQPYSEETILNLLSKNLRFQARQSLLPTPQPTA